MKRKNYHIIYLCILLLLAGIIPIHTDAKTQETESIEKTGENEDIRVAWYEDSYHISGANESRSGYGYEYEQAVSAYTGWNYEYIMGDWTELFEKLQKGDIDLMAAISYTDERAATMLFSELPMGEEKYYLYADLMQTSITASDLTTLNGMRVGMLEKSVQATQFCEWEEAHQLATQHIFVESFEEARSLLEQGQLDCVVSTETPAWMEAGISAVTCYGSSSIYFGISKKRPDIKEKLDNAMRAIDNDHPFYEDELYQKYLSSQSVEVLSVEERDWLSNHGAIRIGYLKKEYGISFCEEEGKEPEGIINDYIRYAGECLSNQTLEFELVGFDSEKQQLQALWNGEIDMVFHVSQNPYEAELNQLSLSNVVWSTNLTAFTAKEHFDENEANRVAVTRDDTALMWYVLYHYPKWQIAEYDTQAEVLEAVKNREADCFLAGNAQMLHYMEDSRLHSIFLMKMEDASFAVRKGNVLLLSILNKTIKSMPSAMLTGALAMYDNAPVKVSVSQFIKDNLLPVTTTFAILTLVVLVIILILLRKSKTAERKAQEAKVQAENANAAKTAFLNNMSHDIRTPINGIIGMLNIIHRSENDPERVRECLQKIEVSSQLLLSLVNDVLDMAKLETDEVILNNESINLDALCNEITGAVYFQAEEAGIHVTGEHDDYRDVFVWSSSLHLKKILLNLFSNCIKYNKPGGSIHTSMHTLERTDEEIICEFRIEDTGIGMTREFIENELFKPFTQADRSARASYRGTGLGMSIVKKIIEKMGGAISVKSRLGEGSTFTVVLPFRLDPDGKLLKEENSSDASIKGMHLLLAEDNELNLEIAEFMLRDNGAQVDSVKNGREAVEKFKESAPGTYDAILMDIMMPVMDGLTASQEIRFLERPDAKTIPIIAMTANAFKEDGEKCLAAGMNAHLAKPLDSEIVIKTIWREKEKNS